MNRRIVTALLTICILAAAPALQAQQKTITILVDARSSIIMGRDTTSSEELPKLLAERLWKSYLSTGKMYERIEMITKGEVLMGTRGAVFDAIQRGQQIALKRVCVYKYKKMYEDMDTAQQARVRKKFKVLFQETFS